MSGNQTGPRAQAPADTSGNQVTVIGDGNKNNSDSASGGATPGAAGGDTSDGDEGSGSGNQTEAGAITPVEASGNQVTVIGDGNTAESSDGRQAGAGDSADDTTSGQDGTGSGNQTDAGATAPADASGNQMTVIGDGNTNSADSTGTEAGGGNTDGNTTNGQSGSGSGNQTSPAATAPVDASGNQVTVIGDGNSSDNITASGSADGNESDTTSGEDGTGSGNQTSPTFFAPADASVNQVTVIGDGNTTERTVPEETVREETVPEEEGSAGPGEPAEGSGGGFGSMSSPGVESGGTAAAVSYGAQAAPAAIRSGGHSAGVLPQTGVSASLLLWALLGLAMLLLGLGLVTGRRREGRPGRPAGWGVAQAL